MAKLLVLNNVKPPIILLMAGIANVVSPLSFDSVVITHGEDGVHKPGSLHKLYAALDLRTKNLTDPDKSLLFDLLCDKFPRPRFDVIFEDRGGPNEHIHIEDNSALSTDRTGAVRA